MAGVSPPEINMIEPDPFEIDIEEGGMYHRGICTDSPFLEDKEMLLQALSQAGLYASGVSAAEVWVLDKHGHLACQTNGSWIDPVFLKNGEPDVQKALVQVIAQVNDYINNGTTLAPGIGIPGILWSGAARSSGRSGRSRFSMTSSSSASEEHGLVWKNMKSFTDDPDQAHNKHALCLRGAGFNLCAGIPFYTRSASGIVVYYARDSVNLEKLTSKLNEEFLLSATEHIGAVIGIMKPRQLSIERKKADALALFKKVRMMLNVIVQSEIDVDDIVMQNAASKRDSTTGGGGGGGGDVMAPKNISSMRHNCPDPEDLLFAVKFFWKTWAHKMLGGDTKPPQFMDPIQVAFIFISSFVTFMIMSLLHQSLIDGLGEEDDTFFSMGAIGALMTVVYGLSPAPASQPRSIILGQGISVLIAMGCSQIEGGTNVHIRTSLAVALAASSMGYLGITHPPGSSVAVAFSKHSNLEWRQFGFLCLSNCIVVVIAATFNNLNSKKLYPTYWGHLPCYLGKKFLKRKSPKHKTK